jgi:hypothetical protein
MLAGGESPDFRVNIVVGLVSFVVLIIGGKLLTIHEWRFGAIYVTPRPQYPRRYRG